MKTTEFVMVAGAAAALIAASAQGNDPMNSATADAGFASAELKPYLQAHSGFGQFGLIAAGVAAGDPGAADGVRAASRLAVNRDPGCISTTGILGTTENGKL